MWQSLGFYACVYLVYFLLRIRQRKLSCESFFCPKKTYTHARSPWTNIKLPTHITRHEFVYEAEFNSIAAGNLSFIFPYFCLIMETNESYFLRFTQHKVSSNINDKVFSDFIKKEKTLYLGDSIIGRLTKYIVCIPLCGNFSLCGNSVFILLISSKWLATF